MVYLATHSHIVLIAAAPAPVSYVYVAKGGKSLMRQLIGHCAFWWWRGLVLYEIYLCKLFLQLQLFGLDSHLH